MLSFHLFFCLPLFLAPFTVPCRTVFAMLEDLERWPYHLSFRFFTMVRRSSCTPIAFITFVLSGPISILYLVVVLSRRYIRTPASSSSSAFTTMSSAKRKLVMSHHPMLTLPSWSSKASHMILSRKMLKRVGESRHPRRTPTVVLNHSPVLPLNRTELWALSYRFSQMSVLYSECIQPISLQNVCALVNFLVESRTVWPLILKAAKPM